MRISAVVLAGLIAVSVSSGHLMAGGAVDVPTEAATIAEALILVAPGGLIRVAEGVHEGGFTIDKSVTIRGGYPADFSSDPDPWTYPTTVVAPGGSNAANAQLVTGDTVSVSGLICTGGAAGFNATLTGDATLNITTCFLRENSRGLVAETHETSFISANQLFIENNSFAGTGTAIAAAADGESAIMFGGGFVAWNNAGAGGAGAFAQVAGSAAIAFNGTVFSANGYHSGGQSPNAGTIVYAVSNSAAFFLNGAVVLGNVPAVAGDAAVSGAQIDDSLVQIMESTVLSGQDGLGGEALRSEGSGLSALRLISNSFSGSQNLAGPIIQAAVTDQAVAFIMRNGVFGNSSSHPLMNIQQLGSSFVNFDGNLVRGNTTSGEFIRLSVSSQASGALVRAINNQCSGNTATAGSGGMFIQLDGPNVGQVGHNTFFANTAQTGVAGIRLVASPGSPAQVSNNIAMENRVGGEPADIFVDGFLVNAIGNFITGDGDPGFRNAGAGDFRLNAASILIDAGHPDAFQIDHDFQVDLRPNGNGYDVGADEFFVHAAVNAAITVVSGSLLSGGVADLTDSDDVYVLARSGFGDTLIDLHNMEIIVAATTDAEVPWSISLGIESRIDEPAGTALVRFRNWSTGEFEEVARYAIGQTEERIGIEALHVADYVDTANAGEIDLSIKHIVFVPFLAFTFESFIDQVEILVE